MYTYINIYIPYMDNLAQELESYRVYFVYVYT